MRIEPLIYWVWGLFVVLLTLLAVFNTSPVYDSSDNAETGELSGLYIRTDHLTGCQYLETVRGGITPRLDHEGNHLCPL